MSVLGSGFANLPGIQAAVETFENEAKWGPFLRHWVNGYIASTAADPTNTPTWELRPGLIMGKITASGQWTNYSATATDGSQVAQGVLAQGLRMQDIFTGTNVAKFFAIMVSGGLQASKLFGLDLMARAQLSGRFIFDDNLIGNYDFPWTSFVTKTGNYQVLAGDNFALFDNTGAIAEVDFTLPAIAAGYRFGFTVVADQTVKVISTEGANMVAFNNAAASSVAFSTGGAKIGGTFEIYSNQAGTKWIVNTRSSGANTVTVA